MRSLTSLNEKWAKWVGHAEEKRKETSKAIQPMRAEERDFGWNKVKVSGLHFLWFDVKSVEGRKQEKVKEIKGRGHSATWRRGKKSEVSECED